MPCACTPRRSRSFQIPFSCGRTSCGSVWRSAAHRLLPFFFLPWLCLASGGCGDFMAFPSVEPAYEGCATDENWFVLDQVADAVDVQPAAQNEPRWLAPAAGLELDAAEPVIFRFVSGSADATGESGDATCPQYQPRSLGTRHLPAVTGTLCDLRFDRDGQTTYRILTTRRVASLPRSLWQALRGSHLRVWLACVRLEQNQIIAGPYRALPREHAVR